MRIADRSVRPISNRDFQGGLDPYGKFSRGRRCFIDLEQRREILEAHIRWPFRSTFAHHDIANREPRLVLVSILQRRIFGSRELEMNMIARPILQVHLLPAEVRRVDCLDRIDRAVARIVFYDVPQ